MWLATEAREAVPPVRFVISLRHEKSSRRRIDFPSRSLLIASRRADNDATTSGETGTSGVSQTFAT